jgi:hypothetical protein
VPARKGEQAFLCSLTAYPTSENSSNAAKAAEVNGSIAPYEEV